MQRSSGPTTKTFVFKLDVSFQIRPKFRFSKKIYAVKNGSVHPNGDSALFCLHKERERERADGVVCPTGKGQLVVLTEAAAMLLCANALSAHRPPPPAPVLEMGLCPWLDWRSEQFARNLRLDAATILNYYCRSLVTGPSNTYLYHGHVLGNKCTIKCQNQTCSRVQGVFKAAAQEKVL